MQSNTASHSTSCNEGRMQGQQGNTSFPSMLCINEHRCTLHIYRCIVFQYIPLNVHFFSFAWFCTKTSSIQCCWECSNQCDAKFCSLVLRIWFYIKTTLVWRVLCRNGRTCPFWRLGQKWGDPLACTGQLKKFRNFINPLTDRCALETLPIRHYMRSFDVESYVLLCRTGVDILAQYESATTGRSLVISFVT